MKEIIKKIVNTTQAIYYLLVFLLFKKSSFNKVSTVFFFPYYHTGGAEKVHAQIVAAVKDQNNSVIFTLGSSAQTFFTDFKSHAGIIELNPIINKRISFVNAYLQRSIIQAINSSPSIKTVFGCNSSYFYTLLPKIKPSIQRIDLFHAFEENDVRIIEVVESAPFIDARVVINSKAKIDITSYYQNHGVDTVYFEKIQIIPNGIVLPSKSSEKVLEKPIRVGFVGRWSVEKRPELFLKIAAEVHKAVPEIEFVMAGSGMQPNLAQITNANVMYSGNISEKEKLEELYSTLSYIVVPSIYEGFPMVIMEAMAFGVIPIATNVGGLSDHIIDNVNGFLVENQAEEAIINAFCEIILKLQEDAQMRNQIAKSAIAYAQENFGIEKFNELYKKILIQ